MLRTWYVPKLGQAKRLAPGALAHTVLMATAVIAILYFPRRPRYPQVHVQGKVQRASW